MRGRAGRRARARGGPRGQGAAAASGACGALLLCLLLYPAVAAAGPDQLWGAAEEPPAVRYRGLCERARAVLDGGRDVAPETLRGTVHLLREATTLYPDGVEGWALLGRALLESGEVQAARPVLELAQRRGAGDSRLLMGLGLLKAQQGELPQALDLYLGLQGRGVTSPLLLRRTGDVQMALGRLGDAIDSYRRACAQSGVFGAASAGFTVPAGPGERTRSCIALAVAYDRDGRLQASAAALKRALQVDGVALALAASDYLPPADREYYRALTVEAQRYPPCDQVAPLRAYLQGAGQGAGQGAPPWPGRSYAPRAEARLDRLRLGAACKAEYSPRPGITDEPLGSQKDRDGGVPWQTQPEDAPK